MNSNTRSPYILSPTLFTSFSNCNITYYVETDGHLKTRAGENISTSPLTGVLVTKDKRLLNKQVASLKLELF